MKSYTQTKDLKIKRKLFVPTARFAYAQLLIATILVFASLLPNLYTIALGSEALLLAVATADLLVLLRCKMSVSRTIPAVCEVNRSETVKICFQTNCTKLSRIKWADSPPIDTCSVSKAEGKSATTKSVELTYSIKPLQRTEISWGQFYLIAETRLGMVAHYSVWYAKQNAKAYPPLPATIGRFGIARRLAGSTVGTHTTKNAGSGGEFDSLRHYQRGDDVRLIDWKATARRAEPIVRQLSFERNQTVLLCVDVSNRMAVKNNNLTNLETSLEAALTLAAEAVEVGDKVGAAAIGRGLEHFLPPRGGSIQLKRLREHFFDYTSRNYEADYETTLMQISAKLKRRSLVVVLSAFGETFSAEHLIKGLNYVATKHLVMFVLIEDSELKKLATAEPKSELDATTALLALQRIHQRKLFMATLASSGVIAVEASAKKLSFELLSNYLKIKRNALL